MKPEKTHTEIAAIIAKKKGGELIFVTDFRGMGTDAAIRKSLSRISAEGRLKRLAHGVYYIPKIDSILGELKPGADEVIEMIAKKEKVKVRPTGAYAMHQLGLTTQMPTRRLYLTNGSARKFHLGKLEIKFKPTTPKKLSTIGEISSLLISALDEIGTSEIEPATERKIIELLEKEDKRKLKHDLKLAPAKIHDYLIKLINKMAHDSVVETYK